VNQKIEGFFDEGMQILTGVEPGERGGVSFFPLSWRNNGLFVKMTRKDRNYRA